MFKNELDWLANFIAWRLNQHFNNQPESEAASDRPSPVPEPDQGSTYAEMLRKFKLGPDEQLVLLLALAPHISPNFLDEVISKNLSNSGDFPQIGGTRGKAFRGMLPTGETAVFLLAGNDRASRKRIQRLFAEDHIFAKNRILWLEAVPHGEPVMSGRIIVNPDIVETILMGKVSQPRFSMDFPAEYITTELEDSDLVLDKSTRDQIAELQNWVKHHNVLMNQWNLKRWVKPGYRALFHGPPGTGKTLTAMLLGKNTGRDVYRIDLSMVVSKYIGETEKNLSQLFDRARSKDWILFFDEADALFGKRTSVRDAHDKYANQEVAYLLQKIESHDGLVILASNFKSNIDEAFIRRFQSVIYFPPPTPAERFLLWKKTLPARSGLKLPTDDDLMAISRKYEITGAGIVNVVQFCSLHCLANNKRVITIEQIQTGIEREYLKEGKVF